MDSIDLPEDRDGFRFRGGARALDLTATLQARLSAKPRELLQTPEDLGRWLRSAGLADQSPTAHDTDLATARRLREAIYALAMGLLQGGDVTEGREVLNAIAAAPAAAPMLDADGHVRLIGPAGALLATLAREAVRLFGGEGARRIRQCASPTCPILFLDTSRKGERRWCSMAACGNRAKVRSYRQRAEAVRAEASGE